MRITSTVALTLLLSGCSATRPLAGPASVSIQEYLRHHPRAALRVADSTGRRQWIYEAELRGDTLRGVRNTSMPRNPIAIPVNQISAVGAPRFSAAHTLGLLGGIAAVAGILALMAPEPVY